MTTARIKHRDKHAISFTASDDLTGWDVTLRVRNARSSEEIDLPCTVSGSEITHFLTGELPPGRYLAVAHAARGAELVTYPNPQKDGSPRFAEFVVDENLYRPRQPGSG